MNPASRLTAMQLHPVYQASQLPFKHTGELPRPEPWAFQARAASALAYGVACGGRQHVFVTGSVGLGKRGLVTQYLQQSAKSMPNVSDWVYLPGLTPPFQVRVLALGPGEAAALQQDVSQMLEEMLTLLPNGLELVQYAHHYQALQDALQQQSAQALEVLSLGAEQGNVLMEFIDNSVQFVAANEQRVLSQAELAALDEAQRAQYAETISNLMSQYHEYLQHRRQWQGELREHLKSLNHESVQLVLGHLTAELRDKYARHPGIVDWLIQLELELGARFPALAISIGAEKPDLSAAATLLDRYQVKAVPQCAGSAPVVYEDLPTPERLFGSVEDAAVLGVHPASARRLRPGAVQRANGGFLLLDAETLLQYPESWEGLKRALHNRQVVFPQGDSSAGAGSSARLETEPMPLQLTVVLIGPRDLYHRIVEEDEAFAALFGVMADFDEVTAAGDNDRVVAYSAWLGALLHEQGLRQLSREALLRAVDYSHRLVEDKQKYSLNRMLMGELLREADVVASEAAQGQIEATHVEMALQRQQQRVERLPLRQREEYRRGSLLLDTQGAVTGQVNGLFVIEAGQLSYGLPARITATARIGDGEVVDIEREVDLGGAIHSKGVYILTAYLASRYGRNTPLSMSASLVLEQSYSQVEGDSASAGEICALLSALACAPVRQSLAITGAINQWGQMQPIGGVNEKIEGFFDVCHDRGLDGTQGVLIPAANIDNLVLAPRLVEAVEAGRFAIHAIHSVDQAMTLLTGLDAGERDAAGEFPAASLNGRVEARLQEFAHYRHEFGKSADEDGEG